MFLSLVFDSAHIPMIGWIGLVFVSLGVTLGIAWVAIRYVRPFGRLDNISLIVLMLVFNFTDWLSTSVLLTHFGGAELNPFLSPVMGQGVGEGFHVIKLIFGSAILAIIGTRFSQHHLIHTSADGALLKKDTRFIPLGVSFLFALASINNAMAIVLFF